MSLRRHLVLTFKTQPSLTPPTPRVVPRSPWVRRPSSQSRLKRRVDVVNRRHTGTRSTLGETRRQLVVRRRLGMTQGRRFHCLLSFFHRRQGSGRNPFESDRSGPCTNHEEKVLRHTGSDDKGPGRPPSPLSDRHMSYLIPE